MTLPGLRHRIYALIDAATAHIDAVMSHEPTRTISPADIGEWETQPWVMPWYDADTDDEQACLITPDICHGTGMLHERVGKVIWFRDLLRQRAATAHSAAPMLAATLAMVAVTDGTPPWPVGITVTDRALDVLLNAALDRRNRPKTPEELYAAAMDEFRLISFGVRPYAHQYLQRRAAVREALQARGIAMGGRLLTSAEAAAALGITDSAWRAYVAREPDGRLAPDLPSPNRWHEATLHAYQITQGRSGVWQAVDPRWPDRATIAAAIEQNGLLRYATSDEQEAAAALLVRVSAPYGRAVAHLRRQIIGDLPKRPTRPRERGAWEDAHLPVDRWTAYVALLAQEATARSVASAAAKNVLFDFYPRQVLTDLATVLADSEHVGDVADLARLHQVWMDRRETAVDNLAATAGLG